MSSIYASFFKETINDEINSIMLNNTWVLVDLSKKIYTTRMQMGFQKKI